jgi:hypothetical protein
LHGSAKNQHGEPPLSQSIRWLAFIERGFAGACRAMRTFGDASVYFRTSPCLQDPEVRKLLMKFATDPCND